MNKLKRKIHANNATYLKMLARHILMSNKTKYPYLTTVSREDTLEEKSVQDSITRFYTNTLKMPVSAARCVLTGKASRLQSLARSVRYSERDLGHWQRSWGNVFTIKFPICVWSTFGTVPDWFVNEHRAEYDRHLRLKL